MQVEKTFYFNTLQYLESSELKLGELIEGENMRNDENTVNVST